MEITNDILAQSVVQDYIADYGENKVNAFLEILANYLCGNKVKDKPYGGSSREVEKIDDIVKRADECPVIKDYADYREYLRNLKKKPESENKKVIIDSIMGTVNDDIRTANDACFPKVQVNNEAAAYFEPDFSHCDYAEAEQVRIILMMPKYNALHPCYYIREDIISIVERNRDHFTRRELEVVECFYYPGGRDIADVAELLNMQMPNVYRDVRTVANKIARLEISHRKQHEPQEL